MEHNIFEVDIFNPDNKLDGISSTSTHYPKIPVLVTKPMKFIAWSDVITEVHTNMNVSHRAFKITEYISHKILSIDNVTYLLQAWS